MKPVYLFLVTCICCIQPVFAQQLPFSEKAVNLPDLSYSALAWGDYDSDGDLDAALTGVQGNTPVTRIMTNNNGIFSNNQSSLPGVHQGSVEWGDYDADDDLDLLITGLDNLGVEHTFILRNDNGIFTDSGIQFQGIADGMASWGDLDNNGKPDILMAGSFRTKLLKNMGNNTFSELSVTLPSLQSPMVSWCDYNNDGWMDILVSGDTGGGFITSLFKNEGGTFTEQVITPEPFMGLYSGQVKWADMDNDGDQDMVITGMDLYIDAWLLVYRNDGNNLFTKFVIPGGNFLDGSLDLGDFNADGLSDIIVMGRTAGCGGTAATLLFENMGFMNFQAVSTLIPGFKQGRVTWGDYNNDGFSDLLFSGLDGFDIPQTSLFLNNLGDTTFTVNTAPTAPGNPGSAVINGNNVLYWSRSFDSKTPSEALTYNVMIGSQCNLSDILSPLANPLTGRRMVAANGNATSDTSFIIRDLVPGDYCFSVQAIDNGYLSGSFSTPEIFQYQPVGINHPQSVPFQLSPNPCSGILHISCNHSELLPASLSIMDMTGQILVESKVPATIDLSALPAGIYLARYMYTQQPFFQKIIKR